MNTEVRVREAMNKSVITISPDATVAEAAKLMADKNIGCVVVVENEKPVGIVTERDITYCVAATDMKPSLVKVRDIMTRKLITISPDALLVDASKKMVKHNIRRLPVIENDRLVGIISNKDILAIAPGQIEILRELVAMKQEGEPVEKEVPERGTCEVCGDHGVRLYLVNGNWVCEDCKEDLMGD